MGAIGYGVRGRIEGRTTSVHFSLSCVRITHPSISIPNKSSK